MKLYRTMQRGWATHVWLGSCRVTIEDAVQAGAVLQYDGNSKDGWFVFIREPSTEGFEISPPFSRDSGDTLRDLGMFPGSSAA